MSSRESTIDELSQALNRREEEFQNSVAQCLTLGGMVSSLRRDVHRLRMTCVRAKETRSHAVEEAVDRARKHFKSANTKRVKRLDGRIEDWVRNLIVELVALDGVPTAKVPQVIERVRRSFVSTENNNEHDDQANYITKEETVSDCSVHRCHELKSCSPRFAPYVLRFTT